MSTDGEKMSVSAESSNNKSNSPRTTAAQSPKTGSSKDNHKETGIVMKNSVYTGTLSPGKSVNMTNSVVNSGPSQRSSGGNAAPMRIRNISVKNGCINIKGNIEELDSASVDGGFINL